MASRLKLIFEHSATPSEQLIPKTKLLIPHPIENDESMSSNDDIASGVSSASKTPRKRKGIHLGKKNYLIAGLFSNFYKEDPLNKPITPHVPINNVIYR